MNKRAAITTFHIWKNAGPSTIDKPTIEKEARAEEEFDLPWQVVVHNDPVNLMSYVTMVFQRVFGYPREKAERHMLEVQKFADATTRSRSPSWIHFSPNFSGKSQQAQIQRVCQPPKNASLARQRTGRKRRFARNGNFMSNLSCGGSFRQQRKQWQRTWNR